MLLIHHVVLEVLKVMYQQHIHITHTPLVRYYIRATIHNDSSGGYFLTGYSWTTAYTHRNTVDGSTVYGQSFGFLRRARVGSCVDYPDNPERCGSRTISSNCVTGRNTFYDSTSMILYKTMATIRSGSDGSGYILIANNGGNHPEYIHDSRVDGSNKYGEALNSFPRRCTISGDFQDSARCGSRNFSSYSSTARTGYWIS